MFNKVILAGNLTRDVELRYLPNGSALAKITLATNRRYKKQDGTQGDEVCYIDVNLWGRTAEVANQYLKKGSSVLIEGRLTLESWSDQNGQKRSKHTITAESMQMLGGNPNKAQSSEENYYSGGYSGESEGYGENYRTPQENRGYSKPNYQQAPKQAPQKEPEIPVINIDDEEVPF